MNLDQLQGNWKQVKGAIHAQWGKLTNDDFEFIAGNRDKLIGRIQERYGIQKEEAKRELRDWEKTHELKRKNICGEEAFDKTERTVSDMYDKTSRSVNSTYEQAVRYSRENPGKTTLIALGVGFGLGIIMGSGPRYRAGRYTQPVINALSDIAAEFLR